MEQTTINPFPLFQKDVKQGLDDIIHFIVVGPPPIPSPKVDDVNTALIDFIMSKFAYPPAGPELDKVELNAYFPTAINAYINNDINGYTSGQAPFIGLLLNKIKSIPPMEIKDFIAGVEEQISQAGLSLPEQNQLYMATAVASTCYDYWFTEIYAAASLWAPYLNTNAAINIANLPYLIIPSIAAALYFCFKGNYQTTEAQPPKISGPNYVTVLTAAVGIAAGKVIFKWTPKITATTNLNNLRLTNPNIFNSYESQMAGEFWKGNACSSVGSGGCTLYAYMDGVALYNARHVYEYDAGKNNGGVYAGHNYN